MKSVFLFAFALVGGICMALAGTQVTAAAQKPVGSYTYYVDGNCDVPVICDDQYEGPSCAQELGTSIVYDAPGCQVAHQTTNILGKLPQF